MKLGNAATAAIILIPTVSSLVLAALERPLLWWMMVGPIAVVGLLVGFIDLLERSTTSLQPAPEGAEKIGDRIVQFLLTLAAAAACLATAVATPALYLFGQDHFTFPNGYVFSLVAWGQLGAFGYVLFNLLSGLERQTHPWFYRFDHFFSVVAWISINLITAAPILVMRLVGVDIGAVTGIPGATQLLTVLVVYSWVDLIYVQRQKRKDLWPQLFKARPQPAPQQQSVALTGPLAQFASLGLRRIELDNEKVFVEVDPAGEYDFDLPNLNPQRLLALAGQALVPGPTAP